MEKKKRIVTKIGNVFCAEIDRKYKCFFQYVANDLSQLNSSVIRVFKHRYPMEYKPVVDDIVKDEVAFYAHTVLRAGIDYSAWYKVGKSKDIDEDGISKVIFGCAQGSKFIPPAKLEVVDPLTNWSIWHINEERLSIGELPEKYFKNIEKGAVIPFHQIINRIKYGYYTFTSPEYKIIKRIPLPDADSYTKIVDEESNTTTYFHFHGEKVIQQIEDLPCGVVRLSEERLSKENYNLCMKMFSDFYWIFDNFISQEEFEAVWNQLDDSK